MHNKERGLGRGLVSLLDDVPPSLAMNQSNVDYVEIERLIPNPDQPRKIFNEEKLKELSESILVNGIIQPIVVNESEEFGKYVIIAGERRYRAAKMAELKSVPVIIKRLDEKETLEVALIENIQRADLSVIEEAEAYKRLIDDFGYSQSDIALSLGKSRSHIANILRLNNLPDSVKTMVNNGNLSMGHARCLIGLSDAEDLAAKIISADLNVRQTEDLVKIRSTKGKKNQPKSGIRNEESKNANDDDMVLLGYSLSEKFGVKVVVENSWNGGKVIFHYSNLEELDSILSKID